MTIANMIFELQQDLIRERKLSKDETLVGDLTVEELKKILKGEA